MPAGFVPRCAGLSARCAGLAALGRDRIDDPPAYPIPGCHMMFSLNTADLRLRWAAARLSSAASPDEPASGEAVFRPGAPLAVGSCDVTSLRRAAVLVPVIDNGHTSSVLLTRRASGLAHHAGQIAFPGGKIQQGDSGPRQAALREAHEEIGLSPEHVDVLGLLHAHETGTGFHIVPVLGVVLPGYSLRLDAGEVAAAFQVPFAFLMQPDNYRLEQVHWQGRDRKFYSIRYCEHYIWGATAAILRQIYERFYRE
jgi:8-oxo-dGTP pyrophosphatase MutT (NUDIX family)